MKRLPPVAGATLSEVLVAIAILPIGLMGAMGAFQAAQRAITQGALSVRALALVESRIEAKRAARWDQLLSDDLDYDGRSDVTMRDDGQDGDRTGSDGVYTGRWNEGNVLLTWTIQPLSAGNVRTAGLVVIEAQALYGGGTDGGKREVKMTTLRANPWYVGP